MMRHVRKFAGVSLIALAIGAAPSAWADGGDDQGSDSGGKPAKSMGEVVVTAPRDVPLTATYSESTITSDLVRDMAASAEATVQTLLNTQPSVFAYADGPLGMRNNIYFRAFNSGQFAETFFGVALNDVFNAGVTNQADNANNVLVTTNDIDSVAVYRGINNPAVNSYNSLGGTIDFLPRRPTDAFGGEVGVGYGSFNTLDVHATLNTGNIGGVTQIFSFQHGASDGWQLYTHDENNNFYHGINFAANDSTELANYFIYNSNSGNSPQQVPEPLIRQFGYNYNVPTSLYQYPAKDTNWFDVFSLKSKLSDAVTFENKFFGGYNDYTRTTFHNPSLQQNASQPYYYPDGGTGYPFWLSYPTGPTYDPAATFGSALAGTDYHFYGYAAYGLGYSPTLTISLPHNVITLGGNLTYGNLHSREYWYGSANVPQTVGYNNAWDEHDTRLFASGYVQDEVSLFDDRLHVTPGVKYIYGDTSDSDAVGFYYPYGGTVQSVAHYIAPTVGVSYQVIEPLAVYGAFGQNIKFPDISSYYGAVAANFPGPNVVFTPHVVPEHVNDYELGVRYQAGSLSAALAYYRESFTKTFVTTYDPNSGASATTNGGSSRYQGVELQLKNDFGKVGIADLSGYVNYAHNQAKFTTSFNSDYAGTVAAGQPLAGVPSDLVSASAVYSTESWRTNIDGRFVGDQYINQLFSGTPSAGIIKAHFTMNLGAEYLLPINGVDHVKSVKLAIAANNVLDKHYYNDASFNTDYNGNNYLNATEAAPRSIFGSVSVTF